MFARRLKNLGNDVQLDVLDSLPHGFLNFSLVKFNVTSIEALFYFLMCTQISKEAQEGSKLCVKRIKVLLGCEEVDEVDG
jgi:hormone-sensitive lipase